jgi:archaellum component FlaG (FlaF/FlaG flagellin family)
MTMGGNLMGEDEMTVSPNPTDDFTTITFKVKEYGHVKLVIKDLMGREYNVILDGSVPKGKYSYMVDLGQLSPGIYVAHLRNTKSSIYQKVVVE